jgi:hypothetical protein
MNAPAVPRRLEVWAARASVAAAVLPILVAGARAAAGGWYPIGDNAFFALRARDVLTEHHPWLGTWTSASLSVGVDLNNPGPLLFDLLALPAKLNPEGGLAIGVAVLNAAAVLLIAWFAHRVGGPRTVTLMMVTAAALGWTMGSELLFDPWQPHSLLFPFLALLVLGWAMAAGELLALPWAVGVGSLILQTHMSYVLLVPGVLVLGVAAGLLVLRRRWRDPLEGPEARSRTVRMGVAAGVVGALAWAQPLWEQIAGDGNLGRLARNAGAGDEPVGPAAGVRLAGSVLGLPNRWLRPSFGDRFRYDPLGEPFAEGVLPITGVESGSSAATSLLVLIALIAAAGVLAARTRGRDDRAAVVMATGVVLLAVATTSALPVSESLGIAGHQLRWLWPVAGFSVVAPLAVLLPRHPAATVGAAVVAGLMALAALPAHNARAGPSDDIEAMPAVLAVARQVQGWQPTAAPLYFDGTTVRFAEPYSTPVLLELQRRGIPFTVDASVARQVGDSRLGPGAATHQLLFAEGDDAGDVPAGSEVLAQVEGLTAAEREELDQLDARLRPTVGEDDLSLSERGMRAQEVGLLPETGAAGWTEETEMLFDGRLLERLVREDWLEREALPPDVLRYAELQRRWDRFTVTVYASPLPTG